MLQLANRPEGRVFSAPRRQCGRASYPDSDRMVNVGRPGSGAVSEALYTYWMQEIAVRAALGARRGRIVLQLLTESLLLSLAGGAIGLALRLCAVRALLAYAPSDLPRLREIAANPALDLRVAGFTFLVAAITGVLFGLVPAVHVSRTELTVALNEPGGRSGTGRSRPPHWLHETQRLPQTLFGGHDSARAQSARIRKAA
jgi:hypothetical protein